jgi:hypothetical protein
MKNYLTQKIAKPETPQQMLGRALKQLRDSKPPIKENPINDSLENLIQSIMSRPRNELIGNLNYVIDNLNELGTDYTITLKTKQL